MLVKLFPKDKLEQEFLEWEENGMTDKIDSVRDCYRLLSISPSWDIDIQYLNYAIKYYQDIKGKKFTNPIERVENYDYMAPAIEIETMSVDYTLSFKTLPSMVNEKLEDIKENFWQYDPNREVRDYLESEIDSIEFYNADVSPNKYGEKNIIK